MFTVTIYDENNTPIPGIPIRWEIQTYRNSAMGGADVAVLVGYGETGDLLNMREHLGRRIAITHSEAGEVWRGFINATDITLRDITVGLTLDGMYNRIRCLFAETDEGSTLAGTQTTTWQEDADSIAQYGVKELVLSASDVSPYQATTLVTRELARRRVPIRRTRREGAAVPFVTLECKGIVHLLGWEYYEQRAGLEEHIALDPVDRLWGWGLEATYTFDEGTSTVTNFGGYSMAARTGDAIYIDSVGNNARFTVTADPIPPTRIVVSGALTAAFTNRVYIQAAYAEDVDPDDTQPLLTEFEIGDEVTLADTVSNNGVPRLVTAVDPRGFWIQFNGAPFTPEPHLAQIRIHGPETLWGLEADIIPYGATITAPYPGTFTDLAIGAFIAISGASNANNNGVRKVITKSSDDNQTLTIAHTAALVSDPTDTLVIRQGEVMTVTPAPVTEGPLTALVEAAGKTLWQTFTAHDDDYDVPFLVTEVQLKMQRFGTFTDLLLLYLYTDVAGSPSGTIGIATMYGADRISATAPEWVSFYPDAMVPLVAGNTYWLSLSVLDVWPPSNMESWFTVSVDPDARYTEGALYAEEGATPRAVTGQDLEFRIIGHRYTTDHVQAVANQSTHLGLGSATHADILTPSFVQIQQYRDGSTTGYDEIIQALATGSVAGQRLLARIAGNDILRVEAQPDRANPTHEIHADGRITPIGVPDAPQALCPVGVWADIFELSGLATQDATLAPYTPVFIEKNEYDPASDRCDWEADTEANPYDASSIAEG